MLALCVCVTKNCILMRNNDIQLCSSVFKISLRYWSYKTAVWHCFFLLYSYLPGRFKWFVIDRFPLFSFSLNWKLNNATHIITHNYKTTVICKCTFIYAYKIVLVSHILWNTSYDTCSARLCSSSQMSCWRAITNNVSLHIFCMSWRM